MATGFSQINFYNDRYTIYDCISQPEKFKEDETFLLSSRAFFPRLRRDGYPAIVLYFNDYEEKEIVEITERIASALDGNGAIVAYGEARKRDDTRL